MRMQQRLVFLGLLGGLLLSSPVPAHAQWQLYDDFKAPFLDPARWEQSFASGGILNPTTEVINVLEANRLSLGVTQYGRIDSNSGTSGGQARLSIVDNPGTVVGMQARVKVAEGEAHACAANSSPSTLVRARAQIVGAFFNDGTATAPGDRTGDILAGIQKARDTILGDFVQAFIVRCPNAACTFTTGVAGQNFLTAFPLGEPHIMTVEWDNANDRFIYSVAKGKTVLEQVLLSYPLTDSASPGLPFKQLAVNNSAVNCLGDRKRSSIEATFDDVMVLRNP